MRVEFVPPNPNEFDRKVSNLNGTHLFVMFSFAEASSGFSKLMVGATNEFFIMSIE